MAKVSVVIPVYKVETTLRQCVESVINQSFTDLEIILIDDGSPDSCGKICEEYQQKDSRIRVKHKKNEGLAKARNSGIKMASGEWILFVDSDDWLEKDYVEKLYRPNMDKYTIAMCGAMVEYQAGRWEKKFAIQGVDEITDLEMLRIVQANSLSIKYNPVDSGIKIDMIIAPWNKLYNRLLLKEKSIYFDEKLEVMEDLYFNLCYLAWVNRIIVVDSYGYNYRYNGVGITKKFDQRQLVKDAVAFNKIDKYAQESSNTYLKEFLYSAICLRLITNLHRYYFAPKNPYSLKRKIEILKSVLCDGKNKEAFEKVNQDTLTYLQNVVIKQAKKQKAITIMMLYYLDKIRKKIKGL